MLLDRLSISSRFLLVLVVGAMFQAALSTVSLVSLRTSMVADRIGELRHLVDVACNVVAFYHDQAAAGAMTDAAARRAAANAVRAMRYDDGNHFFVWDLDGVAIAHGAQPALEGRGFIGPPDALGSPVVATMVARLVEVARSPAREGPATYRIPGRDRTEPLGKMTYSRLFEPWGWSIGTGTYTDDIEAAFRTKAIRDIAAFVAIIAAAGLLSRAIVRDMVLAMDRLCRRVVDVAAGRLDGPVPGTARRDEIGAIARALLVLRDTSREAAELRLDHLTNLPTRRLLMDRMRQLATCGGWCALLLIDLDRFKSLNDTHGHDAGDMLLREVARRLGACVRTGDTVARLGGDEFVVVLVDVAPTEAEAADAAHAVAREVCAALARPYRLGRIEHDGSGSIGVALFAGRQPSVDAVLKRADLAMYRSKEAGGGLASLFDPAMEQAVHEQAERGAEMRDALAGRRFVLHYRPRFDRQGLLRGAEALVVWEHPARGSLPPADFMAFAEESGLILPLGRWALETACAQLARWAGRPGTADLALALDVGPRQFGQPGFADQLRAILHDTGADPRRLALQLPETLLASTAKATTRTLREVASLGVRIALDDFGIGRSSLGLLGTPSLHQLRIDRLFVRHRLAGRTDAAAGSMVVTLAQALGLEVVADGVETGAQWDLLVEAGCHWGQGPLFGEPLPADGFERFARHQWRLSEPLKASAHDLRMH